MDIFRRAYWAVANAFEETTLFGVISNIVLLATGMGLAVWMTYVSIITFTHTIISMANQSEIPIISSIMLLVLCLFMLLWVLSFLIYGGLRACFPAIRRKTPNTLIEWMFRK